jgi:hypothetical protein
MKNNKLFFLGFFCLAAVALATSSCKKVETEPKDWFGSDLVFDTMDRNAIVAGFNLNDLYNYVPGGFNRINGDFLDAASGDAVPSRNNTSVEYFTNGNIGVLNNPDPYWGTAYAGIRRANIFLANINSVPYVQTADSVASKLNRQYWRSEARFIRALLYFELVKRYGGVPLTGDKVFTLEDNLEIPRNTFEQCVDYIVNECNVVKDSLRSENTLTSDPDWGHATRGAAIALKCRTLLYAASPLFNGGGIETDQTKKALTGYLTYDASRWQKVIDAAEQLRALGYFNLLTTGSPTPYAAVFTTKKNVEVIFARQSSNNSSLETSQSPVGYNTSTVTSQGLTSPTQNFVDAFPMLTGLQPINADGSVNTASGYKADSPYVRRDPRLAVTVFHNGLRWLSDTVRTFEGGKDKPNVSSIQVQTKTGYYLRKFLADFSNSTSFSNQSHNFILFRYAEILLNYAEALNEVGRVEDAVTQIKAIRGRAGLTAGTNGRYGINAGISQNEMREVIRNERRIELSFEEHRFWDVRRWKIADNALSGPLYGMKITRANNVFSYQKVQVGSMLFQPKLYHMPLPYDETTKNLQLVQNEGW